MTGKGFAGAIAYCLDDNKRNGKMQRVIASSGVMAPVDENGKCIISSRDMARSFRLQASMNPRVTKPVKHIVLSWKEEDLETLTDEKMAETATEYMQKMGYTDTQYLIVRHSEKNNPHCHIILNAVNGKGSRISDSNDRLRNQTVCREITEEHNFTFGYDKYLGFTNDISDPRERCRYHLSQEIASAITKSRSIEDFPKILSERGINTRFTKDADGNNIGISFSLSYEGVQRNFSGTGVSPKFTLKRIERLIRYTDELPLLKNKADSVIDQLSKLEEDFELSDNILKKKKELLTNIKELERFRKQIRPKMAERIAKDLEEGVYVLAATVLFGQPAILCIAFLAKCVAKGIQLIKERDAREEEEKLRTQYNSYRDAEHLIINPTKKGRGFRR